MGLRSQKIMMNLIRSHNPKKHVKSFFYASRGLGHVFMNEANFRVHIVATLLVSTLAYFLKFSYFEWIFLAFTIGFVLILEIVNTLVEEMVDHLVQEHSESARIVKDLGAAAVFLAAILSVFVGCLLFIPKLVPYF